MDLSLTIGDFARATHLTVKTLRHYHRVGLLEPAQVDPGTGYRRYTTDQIPTAQVIRRFRNLDMPLEDIHAVITAPDLDIRNHLITAHLSRLQDGLARTQAAVTSLSDLLQHPSPSTPGDITHRTVAPTPALAISEIIDIEDATTWYQGALGELHATLAAQRVIAAGPAGGIYSNDLFSHGRGPATVFIPCDDGVKTVGRVASIVVLAVIVHAGVQSKADLAYGALATYVTEHALGVDGPLREYYVIGRDDNPDETAWRTEICWPIFHTGKAPSDATDCQVDGSATKIRFVG
jgi:DNA-binding transcriptional MerR regulator